MVDLDFFKNVAKKKRKLNPAGFTARQLNDNAVVLRQKDFNAHVDVPEGKQRRRKLTPKQIILAEYLLKGATQQEAMRKAGYSKHTRKSLASKKKIPTVMAFVETMEEKLKKQGLTEAYMARKLSEWVDARKTVSSRAPGKKADEGTDDFIDVPDYDTQIKAFDRWEKIFNPNRERLSDVGKKRQVSFTEWINGDKTTTEEQQ